jgi:hypothetical protein
MTLGTSADTTYRNTPAWFMTFNGRKVVDGTAFYNSIAFNELWKATPVRRRDQGFTPKRRAALSYAGFASAGGHRPSSAAWRIGPV